MPLTTDFTKRYKRRPPNPEEYLRTGGPSGSLLQSGDTRSRLTPGGQPVTPIGLAERSGNLGGLRRAMVGTRQPQTQIGQVATTSTPGLEAQAARQRADVAAERANFDYSDRYAQGRKQGLLGADLYAFARTSPGATPLSQSPTAVAGTPTPRAGVSLASVTGRTPIRTVPTAPPSEASISQRPLMSTQDRSSFGPTQTPVRTAAEGLRRRASLTGLSGSNTQRQLKIAQADAAETSRAEAARGRNLALSREEVRGRTAENVARTSGMAGIMEATRNAATRAGERKEDRTFKAKENELRRIADRASGLRKSLELASPEEAIKINEEIARIESQLPEIANAPARTPTAQAPTAPTRESFGAKVRRNVRDLLTSQRSSQKTQVANGDNAAMKWARANPNDPRAKRILALQGAG